MNFDFDIVMVLALITIGSVLVIGLVSRMRAKKAQDHHDDAAVAQRQRAEDGTEGEEPSSGRTWSEERGRNPPTANPPTPMPPRN